jgi:hypothetical protein
MARILPHILKLLLHKHLVQDGVHGGGSKMIQRIKRVYLVLFSLLMTVGMVRPFGWQRAGLKAGEQLVTE